MSTVALLHRSELPAIVVMGVAGCGKSTIGKALSCELGAAFLEGDEFHPTENIAKMSAGQPLDDSDRAPWLKAVGREIGRLHRSGRPVVAACSALKRRYREVLVAQSSCSLIFVMLEGTRALISERLALRTGHSGPAR